MPYSLFVIPIFNVLLKRVRFHHQWLQCYSIKYLLLVYSCVYFPFKSLVASSYGFHMQVLIIHLVQINYFCTAVVQTSVKKLQGDSVTELFKF